MQRGLALFQLSRQYLALFFKLSCLFFEFLLVELSHLADDLQSCADLRVHLIEHSEYTLRAYNVLLHDYITLQRLFKLHELCLVELSDALVIAPWLAQSAP